MIVDSAHYVDGIRAEGRFDTSEAARTFDDPHSFIWVGLFEPTKAEFDEIRRHVELPDLVVEDALNAHQRPKLEPYDDDLFVVLKTARYLDREEEVEYGEIQVFLTPHAVLHVRHNAPSKLVGVRAALEHDRQRLQCGPGAVLHAIIDHIVDDYEPVVDGIEQDIREVERQVFTQRLGENPVGRIYGLMRTILIVQDNLGPLVTPLQQLSTRHFPAVHEDLHEYFRDALDHLEKILTRVSTFHDLLSNILAANLTRVTVRQNEDMRKISAWVAIAAVPTAIAGIYGMNFEHMPELEWWFGYPFALGLMFGICVFLYRKFKHAGWL